MGRDQVGRPEEREGGAIDVPSIGSRRIDRARVPLAPSAARPIGRMLRRGVAASSASAAPPGTAAGGAARMSASTPVIAAAEASKAAHTTVVVPVRAVRIDVEVPIGRRAIEAMVPVEDRARAPGVPVPPCDRVRQARSTASPPDHALFVIRVIGSMPPP